MKRILFTCLLAIAAGLNAFAMPETDNGHTLTALWKQYEAASRADRPQQEAQLLTQIKQEAIRQHLPVDFYDAATLYVSTVERRDWKQRDQLRAALEEEVKAFGDPMVTFHWMNAWKRASTDELWAYVQAHPEGFQGHTPAFYRDIQQYLGGTLKPFVQGDREYVLWRVLGGRRYTRIEDDEIYQALLQEVKGRYPADAALAYYVLNTRTYKEEDREERRQALGLLASQYAGKAVSLYPKADLLQMRKEDLDRQKASGQLYESLCGKARALEAERKAYTGTEATIAKGCRGAESLIGTLTDKDLELQFDGNELLVLFRNLPQASVTLRSGKKSVKSWKAQNPAGSFYVRDSVRLALPALEDGDYTAEAVNGQVSASAGYTRYTLSIATRTDSRGPSVYVADYETGEPLGRVTLQLLKGDKVLAKSTLRLNGFTPLPEAITKKLDKDSYRLEAISGSRRSRSVWFQPKMSQNRYDDFRRCHIFKDQGAYNPGDTVRFKAVVFEGNHAKGFSVCKGTQVELRLHDSEDNVLETLKLTTNAWGAVSGRFVLPRGLRNGRFEIEAVGLGADWFRVDEFVLPSYDLAFDTPDQLYLKGDEVPVSGVLKSYSGHSLFGARVAVKVQHYDTVVLEESQEVGSDNRFSFKFPALAQGYYHADVTVTESGGEMRSFGTGFYISNELSVEAEVDGDAQVDLTPVSKEEGWNWRHYSPTYTLLQPSLQMTLLSVDGNSKRVPVPVSFQVLRADDSVLASGQVRSGERFSVDLPAGGFYKVVTTAEAHTKDGEVVKGERTFCIYCILPGDKTLMPQVQRAFVPGPLSVPSGGAVSARVGSGEGLAHALVLLYGEGGKVLEARCLKLSDGALQEISFPYKAAYPDVVRLQVFYFLHGKAVTYDWQYRREKDRFVLPVQFTRFQDKAYPGTEYSFSLKTSAGTEVLVAAWDKSLDAVSSNDWPQLSTRETSVPQLSVYSACGSVGSSNGGVRILGYGRMTKNMTVDMMAAPAMMADAEEEAIPFQLVEEKASFGSGFNEEVDVRTDFASALTFQPHLRPGADGTLNFSFRTSDKLSTYYVRAYAHDAAMRNALCEQEMVVSLPVKVSLTEPRFLFEGDVYEAAVTVSSITDRPVSGTLVLVMATPEVSSQMVPVTVPAGETVTRRFKVVVPSGLPAEGLTLRALFKAPEFSDGVQVTVPVYPAAQELTEAHSAVLHAGEDREALLRDLRSRFVNVPSSEAILREITVLDMVRAALPAHVEPAGKDVLSLSEAWYVNLIAISLEEGALSSASLRDPVRANAPESAPSSKSDLLDKILACRNADGGFGWFEGMRSSPAITAVLLERMARLRDRGFSVPDMTDAVKYLDARQFDDSVPYWYGGISDAQYLHVRALYASVPFQVKAVSEKEKKRFKAFTKWAKDYLTPSRKDGRGLQGRILEKARRLLTLRNLLQREGGLELAKAWGVGLGASAKLQKSMKADLTSLLEYAVEHRDGGWYYPNAVMPWRGLMESEAYAHALLCDLLTDSIADGIRLWLMLQKETQKWDASPEFVDAITAILDGSEAVLGTRVLALSGSYRAPFSSVKASGNGFTVERKFYREVVQERVYDDKTGPNDQVNTLEEIQPGDPVSVGDRIVVKYHIWNGENRSFVRLTAGREAALQPEQQLSGSIGYGFIRPVRSGVVWGFVPQGYRNVKASATEYYFDSYPEENTVLQESFFVQQAGRFVAPAVVIESLYAPHYRANSAYRGPVTVMAPASAAVPGRP